MNWFCSSGFYFNTAIERHNLGNILFSQKLKGFFSKFFPIEHFLQRSVNFSFYSAQFFLTSHAIEKRITAF